MDNYIVQKESLEIVADAIRAKAGTTGKLVFPHGWKAAVDGITGGGSGGNGSPVVIDHLVNIGAAVSIDSKFWLTPASSAFYETTGGTTLTGDISAKAGDWILATVTTRSATTFPSDWTVLRSSTVLDSSASNQRMFFLCKQVTEGGVQSITVTQTDSARIYINLLCFAGIQGFKYHSGTEVYSNTGEKTVTVTRPAYDLVVWGCTTNLWASSSPYGVWLCDDLPAYSLTGVQARQANFIDNDPSVTQRVFTPSPNSDGAKPYIIDCVEVLV